MELFGIPVCCNEATLVALPPALAFGGERSG